MKRIMTAVFIAVSLGTSAYAASGDVKVILDGREIQYDVPPQIINDTTMVPVRATFEAMGMDISWDGDKQLVTAVSGNDKLEITINSDTIKKNGKKFRTATPAMIIGERTLIPLRAVSELSDYIVEWNGDTYTVTLSSRTNEQMEDKGENNAEEANEAEENEPETTPAATEKPQSTQKPASVSTAFSISQTKAQMFVGTDLVLEVTSDYPNDEFLWSTSDKNIAAVDQNGKVSAKYPGTCRIYAESKVTGKKKTCTVNIGYENASLRFPAQSKTMDPGELYTPKLLVSPDSERSAVKWETSDKNIAAVKNGQITAKSAGTAVITAKNALDVTAQITINVNPGGVARVEAELEANGSAPSTKAAQGVPVGISLFNKSDTDIVIMPDARLSRNDGSEYDATLSKFNKNSKVVSQLDTEVKITKGARRVVYFAIKHDGPPEGFSFKEGDKITMQFNCGGILYEGIIDKYGRVTVKSLENNE